MMAVGREEKGELRFRPLYLPSSHLPPSLLLFLILFDSYRTLRPLLPTLQPLHHVSFPSSSPRSPRTDPLLRLLLSFPRSSSHPSSRRTLPLHHSRSRNLPHPTRIQRSSPTFPPSLLVVGLHRGREGLEAFLRPRGGQSRRSRQRAEEELGQGAQMERIRGCLESYRGRASQGRGQERRVSHSRGDVHARPAHLPPQPQVRRVLLLEELGSDHSTSSTPKPTILQSEVRSSSRLLGLEGRGDGRARQVQGANGGATSRRRSNGSSKTRWTTTRSGKADLRGRTI